MAHLAKMYADKKVQFGTLSNDHGFTQPANVVDARNGKSSPSTVTMSEQNLLTRTPEGLASFVAHEVLHAYRFAQGIAKHSLLDSETDAQMAAATVWASFGKEKYRSASPSIVEFDELSDKLDPADSDYDWWMRTHTAVEYAFSYAGTGDPRELENGAAMVNDLLSGLDAGRILKFASNSQIMMMTGAYGDFLGHSGTQKTSDNQLTWDLLFKEMDSRDLWDAKGATE